MSEINRLKVQNLCQKSLELCRIGENQEEIQNGLDFYK